MLYGLPVYMYRFPNMTAPDGTTRNYDNQPSVVIPHEFNYGYKSELLETGPLLYPEGFNGTTVSRPSSFGIIICFYLFCVCG
jgi:hypothetical protein